MKLDTNVKIVFDAMIQAVIDRADPDDPLIARATAKDFLYDMKYYEIKDWSNNISLKVNPRVIKFNPADYSFTIEEQEDV